MTNEIARLTAERDDLRQQLDAVLCEVVASNQLKVIGQLISTQDNRCTDQPMFVVFQKREIIGSDEHSPSRIVWVWDGEEVDDLRARRLELLHQDGRSTRGYDRYAMQEVDEFVTCCFTEQGCKDHLRINGHNLRLPYIFAAGSFRNSEYQAVRNFLLSLNNRPTTDRILAERDAEMMARGVDRAADRLAEADTVGATRAMAYVLRQDADQLRAGASTMIKPMEVQRNEFGCWTHPEYNAFCDGRESISTDEFDAWATANGLQWAVSYRDEESLEDDDDGADLSSWQPESPADDGWFIGSIHDSEDGAVCIWLRNAEGK